MIGVGIDLVQLSRIEKLLENPRFAKKILTANELIELEKQKRKTQWLAGRFAVKEAVSKALGIGIAKCPPNEVETLYDELGAPKVVLYSSAKKAMQDKGVTEILISISHEGDYATAIAIAK